MKLTTVLELLLILIIISFAAQAKPLDKAHKNGRKGLGRQSETAVVAPAAAPADPVAPVAAAGTDDDEEFDIFDIFDDDDDDEADDDDDDDDESEEEADDAADDDDDDDSEEEAADTDDDSDAIDLFSDLLEDDEDATPKPKPTTVAPVAAVAAVAPEAPTPEISVVPLNEKPPKRGQLETPEEAVEDEEEEEEVEESRKPTPKPTKSNGLNKQQASQLLPLLTIQNTPALLELQAQLIGNTKNKPLEKPKKKKKTKGSVKKQAAILSNEIGEGGDMRETVELTESPLYEIKVKKGDNKPEVSVEGPIMEKIKLVKPENQKKKTKPSKAEPVMTKQESEELYDDEESTTLSS